MHPSSEHLAAPPVLYDPCMVESQRIRAWRPAVAGVAEVFHAHFTDHVYPMHTHDSWTLLIVDTGMVSYDLERHAHLAVDEVVTLLPPHVSHNGRSVTSHGFQKRVLYLDMSQLEEQLIGRAVDAPVIADPVLRGAIHRLHQALAHPGDEFAGESWLALVGEHLRDHLRVPATEPVKTSQLAHQLRDLLNACYIAGISLADASAALHAHPAHLVRAFSKEFGIAPHQYLTGRRVDHARRLLLDGLSTNSVAVDTGFYDQSHLNRHFKKIVGISPSAFARSAAG